MRTKIIFSTLFLSGCMLLLLSFSNKKPNFLSYTITISAGHPAKSCFGVGESCSFLCNGMPCPCHIPCWGSGSDCTHTIKIGLIPSRQEADGKIIYEATLDLTQDGFSGQILNMPARSAPIEYEGAQQFLNIPAQIIAKADFNPDIPTYIYAAKNITVTNAPLYSNQ